MEKNVVQLAPDGLLKLLREQRDLYLKLKELSERQRVMIAGDRPEQLLNILRDRQNLVSALARVNEKLSPYRRDWQQVYDRLPDDSRQAAQELLDEINGMLQIILHTDQEDQALLSARKQAVARSLGSVSEGRAANAAYAKQGGSGSGSTDYRG